MNASPIPFFSELPPKAVKAACRLFDAIQSPDYNGITAYHDFCHDLTIAAVTPPGRALVKRWQAGVQLGVIDRPAPFSEVPSSRKAKTASVSEAAADAEREPVRNSERQPLAAEDASLVENASSLLDAISSGAPIASPPGSTLRFQEQPALLAVRTAAGRLLEETIIQLSQSIERTAREHTARMLRDVADELERLPS